MEIGFAVLRDFLQPLREILGSMKIKSIIVDDEKNGRENLSGILKQHCPKIEILDEANSVESAIKLIHNLNPDLVFLDIEMPKENGFKLLEYFSDFNFEVIFVTAYGNYAIKAIRFSAADYILKPINYIELKTAVKKVSKSIQQKKENQRLKQLAYNLSQPNDIKIGLPTGDRIEFVRVKDIIHCKGEGNYSHIYYEQNKHLLVAKTLVEFENLLNEHSFIRVHKSHLVNLKHIVAYSKTEGGTLQLSNGDKVDVSRRRKEDVKELLKLI